MALIKIPISQGNSRSTKSLLQIIRVINSRKCFRRNRKYSQVFNKNCAVGISIRNSYTNVYLDRRISEKFGIV